MDIKRSLTATITLAELKAIVKEKMEAHFLEHQVDRIDFTYGTEGDDSIGMYSVTTVTGCTVTMMPHDEANGRGQIQQR